MIPHARSRAGTVLEDDLIQLLAVALRIDSALAVSQLIFEDDQTLSAKATKAFGRAVRYLGKKYVGEHVFHIA